MRFDFATAWTIFRAELRMALRDRRAVMVAFVLPMFLMPAVLLSTRWTIKKHEQAVSQAMWKYTVGGSESNAVRAALGQARQRMNATTNRFRAAEQTCPDPLAALNSGQIDFIIEGLTPAQARALETNMDAVFDDGESIHNPRSAAAEPRFVARVLFRGDHDRAAAGAGWIRDVLGETRLERRASLLRAAGFEANLRELFGVTPVNLASRAQVAGQSLGRALTVFVLFFIFTGSAMVATDLLAGEKERGTLETLLTSAAGRAEIIAAKCLVVIAAALATTATQFACMMVCAGFRLLPLPEGVLQALNPGVIALLFFLYIPMAVLAAGVLLLTSGRARNYREAQSLFLPVLLVGMLPALAPLLPGLSTRSILVVVPVANIALSVKEILSGSFDWLTIAASWVTTAAAALWSLRLSARALCAEKLVTAADADETDIRGGPALFERRVLLWFAGMWGALMLASNYIGGLDIRAQILVNLVGVFFVGCALMIRLYRLDIRRTLSLRWPKPAVWLAVIAGVPGGIITGEAVMQLANTLIPTPPKVIESFSHAVLPQDVSTVQLVFFLAVLPAIFEEITFRGLLLSGLRRRMSPVMCVLTVGLVFGFFHMALFRLAPTAFLGMLLAGATFLSGSIYPAMVWHASSNALGLLAAQDHWDVAELDWPVLAAGPVLLACAFWILWRERASSNNSSPNKRDVI